MNGYSLTCDQNNTRFNIATVITANGGSVYLDAGAANATTGNSISNSGRVVASDGAIRVLNTNTIVDSGFFNAPTIEYGIIGNYYRNGTLAIIGQMNINATGNIDINGSLVVPVGGLLASAYGVSLNAGGADQSGVAVRTGDINIPGGSVDIESAGALTVGLITAEDSIINSTHINSANLAGVTGNITLSTDTIDTTNLGLANHVPFTGNVNLIANDINVTDDLSSLANVALTANNSLDVAAGKIVSADSAIIQTASFDNYEAIQTTTNLSITSASISLSNRNLSGYINLSSTTGDITLNNISAGEELNISSAGNLTISNSGDVEINDVSAVKALTLTAQTGATTGSVRVDGTLTAAGNITLKADDSIIVANGAAITATGATNNILLATTTDLNGTANGLVFANHENYGTVTRSAGGVLFIYEDATANSAFSQSLTATDYGKTGARTLGSAIANMATYVNNHPGTAGAEGIYQYSATALELAEFMPLISTSVYGDSTIYDRLHLQGTGYKVVDPVTLETITASGSPVYTTEIAQTTNAGKYDTTYISGLSAEYYTIGGVAAQFTVTPATLTVTANNALRLVGYPNPQFSASYNGFVNGDGPSDLDPQVQFSTTASQSSGAGRYAITPEGAGSPNYAFNYVNGSLTVVGATPSGGSDPVPGLMTLSAAADSNNNSNNGTEEDDNSGNGTQRSRMMRSSAPMAAVAVGNTINPVENADYSASHYNIEPSQNVQQRVAWIRTRGKCCLKPPCDPKIPMC